MHVIIDATTTQDQFAYSGIGQYTKNIILALAKFRSDLVISLLLFNDKESTLDKSIKEYKNIYVSRIGKYKESNYMNSVVYKKQMLPVIMKLKRRDSVYFCPYFWRYYPADKMPTVLFVHDMILPLYNIYSQKSKLANLIRKSQYWDAMNQSLNCAHILCNSDTTRMDYLKYYPEYKPENVTTTYLGLEMEQKDYPLSEILPSDYKERGYFIYLGGGISESKNSAGVIDGYANFADILKSKGIDVFPYLVVAGGKFQDTIRKEVVDLYSLIERYGLTNDVFFTGFYPDDAKYALLHNSIAFVHLSLYEGFGISVLEALRSKALTIIDKNPAYVELFDNFSCIVDGTKPEECGSKMYDIYMDQFKYEKLVRMGYDYSLEFTWEYTARKTYKVLLDVLKENNGVI